MSSKLEEIVPLSMSEILVKAGHGKFKRDQVLQQEADILMKLKFKLY